MLAFHQQNQELGKLQALKEKFLKIVGKHLNEQQALAVTAPEKKVLVLAGAGTGKTTVITHRVAYLLWIGVPRHKILLATFTNKAARMMLSRVEDITGIPSSEICGGTFHHISNIFLRRYSAELGFRSNFTILDEDDAKRLLKQIREEFAQGLDKKELAPASLIYQTGSLARNSCKEVEDVILKRHPEYAFQLDKIISILASYQKRKEEHNLMDFDDLLVNFVRLLSIERIGKKIAENFEHVLVDEFQDTNALQAEIVRKLTSVHGCFFIVGDDAQSIYGFRAADYRNILNVPLENPDTKIYKLEVNYRSVPQILDFANSIMKAMNQYFERRLVPVRNGVTLPKLIMCQDPVEQAEVVATQIEEFAKGGTSLAEIGVLYRSHKNSLELEVALRAHGIPYEIRGGVRFMERAHIKDLLSYLAVLVNPHNELAFSRILSLCQGVGKKTVEKILMDLRKADNPLEAFLREDSLPFLKGKARKSLTELKKFLVTLRNLAEAQAPIEELLSEALDIYYKDQLSELYEDIDERMGDISQLISYAANYESIDELLAQSALNQSFTGRDIYEDEGGFEGKGRVTLTTIHQAKGLEWEIVFLTDLNDGNLPHRMCFGDSALMEEERRLFYVAVTRAKDYLFVSFTRSPTGGELSPFQNLCKPSRFLLEIPQDLYEEYIVEGEEDVL